MTPALQTICDADTGNCFAASLASVLDLPVGDVPNFAGDYGDDWERAADVWLASKGLRFVTIGFASYETFANTYFGNHGAYCIVSGPSNYANRGHAMVGRVSESGGIEIVHNPQRGAAPLPEGFRWVRFIVRAYAGI
jgi:hypothetical protein